MTDSLDVDPQQVRHAAADLAGLAGRADAIYATAESGQGAPTAADFPEVSVGQDCGRVWDDARPVFADGTRLVRQRLAYLAAAFTAAAAGYEEADATSALQMQELQ
jgi:hypothetical protein